jgi:ATP-binding protein involved in chromosome partitioning
MFEKVGVPILGIVEHYGRTFAASAAMPAYFGADGGKKMAAEYKMDYLGAPGWITQIRLQADNGRPTVVSDPGVAALYKWRGPQGRHHRGGQVRFSSKFLTITISKNTRIAN